MEFHKTEAQKAEGRKQDSPSCRKAASGKKRLLLWLAFLLSCLTALALLAVHVVEQLLAGYGAYLSWENMPVLQLLWAAVRRVLPLFLPLILPVAAILFVCFLLFAARNLATENRRFGTLKAGTACVIIGDSLQQFCFSFLKVAPVAAVLFVTAVGIKSLFLSVNRVTRIADNLKRIKELGIMVRNLSRSEDVARITMLDRLVGVTPGDMEKRYRVEILSEDGEVVSSQEVTLRGNRIAIDSITVNFEYSEIESGRRQNIAYPYRVYSELMKPEDAVPLTCMFNDEELPVIYCLEADSIYGMTEDVFFQRLRELFAILKDEELSREMGIRSTNGTVNHFVMNPGDVYNISVEATGGLTVHKKLNLD
ncbi:MAG: hypothetical protein II932_08670 [Treponema sp.]|nr:hypothetical protein [Treponema sp.]